jgi:mRNA-degrading endonuclease RelE of RelBE toxin-antitoxin system
VTVTHGNMPAVAYRIEFSRPARMHFSALDAHQRAMVRDGIVEQLLYQPAVETRRRKLMRPNTLAGYRLRIDPLRVYYDVGEDDHIVVVQAIGVKVRNRILIGGKEIEL